MLDIRFIREKAALVSEKAKQKGYEVDIEELLRLDEAKKALLQQIEQLRSQRNEQANKIKSSQPTAEDIERGKQLKQQLSDLEAQLQPIDSKLEQLIKSVPNMPAEDVPVGSSESDNVVSKEWGEKPTFDFQPRTHWQIAENRGLIDKQRAAKVAGSRFAYIKGNLVRLQMALISFTLEQLGNEQVISQIVTNNNLAASTKPFVPLLPPAMIKTEIFEAMDRLDPADDRYKVGEDGDNLWLQGSAEHTIGPMYQNEILSSEELPIRYVGYLTSFRREAGSYGKDTEGIIRMHQFDKLEMESFTKSEAGMDEHLLMVAIQEHLMQCLKLPYRVLTKCTADIGKPNARGIDIEAWLPGAAVYKETHTADYMTDYQARRLQTRYKSGNETAFVHTNDATAFALGRTMVAIVENYQKADGSVAVPEVLKKYLPDITHI